MRIQRIFLFLALTMGLFASSLSPARADATLELYGTFHAMGVIITLDTGDDPDGDATANVEYRVSGSGSYRQGFPPTRTTDTHFVGSLFWLEPGTAYDVRVTFSDPDGALHNVTVEGTASTRAEISIPTPTHSYYVSPTGSGTACSEAAPCALSYGLDQAQPGEEIVLRGGTYYKGEIDAPRSGTSGAPIVIRGYDGEEAVLDGADPATFAWTVHSGSVYRATINVENPHVVLADGARLFPYDDNDGELQDDLDDLQTMSRDNTPGFRADGTTLYVHLAGDADPNNATVAVSRYNYAFYVEQDFVYFLNLTFRHYGQGSWAKAIYFNNASDNLVQGCTFASNDLGVGIKRESHRNVIQDSEFYDTIFDWPWADIKELGGLEDGGVRFYDPVDGRGNVIRRNTFHDDFDGFGACPASTDEVTNEIDVYENLVHTMGDDGVETDGDCSNVRIWDNTFHDVLMGISLAPARIGPVYAIRNLIYRTGVGNNTYTGSPFKFNSSGYGHSGTMYLFHNTSDAALPGNNGIYIKAPGTWDMIYARNNVWAGTNYALNNYNETQPIDFDYDDLYTTNPDEFVYWGSGPDRHMHDLETFQTLTGQELHGLDVEPGFADASNGDYALDPASDLIDAGVVIPGINDDYVGAAPDIGAYEYQGDGFTLTADPSSRAINPGGVAVYTLSVQPIGSFSATVNLIAASPSPSLTLSLTPTTVTPLGQTTLTVTDTHIGTVLVPGLRYTLTITATGGGSTQTAHVGVLVGGMRVYLPLTLRSYGP